MDFDKRTEDAVNRILKSYEDKKKINGIDIANQPDKKAIIEIIHKLLKILCSQGDGSLGFFCWPR